MALLLVDVRGVYEGGNVCVYSTSYVCVIINIFLSEWKKGESRKLTTFVGRPSILWPFVCMIFKQTDALNHCGDATLVYVRWGLSD